MLRVRFTADARADLEDALSWYETHAQHVAPEFQNAVFLGFWNKKLGILGALGSCMTFVGTVTIIPFMPDGWDASAGGFPAMTGKVPFLMKDVVLLSVSFYLLKQDVQRVVMSSAANHDDLRAGSHHVRVPVIRVQSLSPSSHRRP
jgi:hypothetical protein